MLALGEECTEIFRLGEHHAWTFVGVLDLPHMVELVVISATTVEEGVSGIKAHDKAGMGHSIVGPHQQVIVRLGQTQDAHNRMEFLVQV
ncbi:hypothetical protein D3C84_991760 [compost metagenome]